LGAGRDPSPPGLSLGFWCRAAWEVDLVASGLFAAPAEGMLAVVVAFLTAELLVALFLAVFFV